MIVRLRGAQKDGRAKIRDARVDLIMPVDIEIDPLIGGGLLQIGQQAGVHRPGRPVSGLQFLSRDAESGRKVTIHVHIVMECQADLPQIVATRRSSRGFSGVLNGGQQQRNQNGDDGNNHQQFHQRESTL